jgi:hypothetical protein
MTKKSRTVLFFSCLLAFLVASPLAILYSQGYRINFNPEPGGKVIVKTGGFFVKAQPRQAEIYVDGQLEEKTDFFFGSAFVKNLLPKKHKFEIKKDGYFTWEKTIEIKEKQVAEAKLITLFPRNISFLPLVENEKNPFSDKESTTTIPTNIIAYQKINNEIYYLDATGSVFLADLSFLPKEKLNEIPLSIERGLKYNFKISPDRKKIVYFSDHEIWIVFLQDISEQPSKKAGDNMLLTRFSEKIGDVFWMNPDYLLFSAGNRIKISEIDDRDKINSYDIGEFTNPKIIFSQANNKLYVLSEEQTYSSDPLLP